MQYKRFEDLPVWQDAAELARMVYEFMDLETFRRHPGLRDQLERAALSISNNIAEGFERGTTRELINFLYIARGSAGESRSMLRLFEGQERLSNFRSEISNLIGMAVNISKQLHGWLESLKNSDIKGVKFLTDKERM